MKKVLSILSGLVLALSMAGSAAAGQPITIGAECDRTGPTQTVGIYLCPGFFDYIQLVNSKGGVMGHIIRVDEVDHEYKVPPAVESYERFKAEHAVSISVYGTPQIYALTESLTRDHIPGTSPGFGRAAAADGTRFPYIFPIAATYWSQAAASVKYVKDQLGGSLKEKKIAFLFYDNPAGREPLPILEALQKKEGFELREFAVPPPGLEMGAQILDIARRYDADFVIAHLFGRAPSLSIKEFKRAGYPLNHVVSFVWGAAEADVEAAGGYGEAAGYQGLEFAGVGENYPVLAEIRAMYAKEGKPEPKEMKESVYYNRGVLIAALHVEAIRNALKTKPDGNITGEDVKKGFEKIRDFTLGGLVPPLEITPTDHEGGGLVEVWQVAGGKWAKRTDWFKAYPQVVAQAIKEAK